MSFASNKTAHTVPKVSRGRIVIGGGFKNGGFSMYGSTRKKRSTSNTPTLSNRPSADERLESKLKQQQYDLKLRRAIRKKSGKFYDTESMKITQTKIDRYFRKKRAKRNADVADAMKIVSGLTWFIAILLLTTGLWLVGVVMILIKLTRRFWRKNFGGGYFRLTIS